MGKSVTDCYSRSGYTDGGGPASPGPSQTQHEESAEPVHATSHSTQLMRSPDRR